MESESKELINKIDDTNKILNRIADAVSVFKVAFIAFVIAILAVVVKNFME